MPLIRITPVKQKSKNTCWLACLRMILPVMGKGIHDSDAEAAKQLGWSLSKPQDINAAVTALGLHGGNEDDGKGKFSEIKSEIDQTRPVIALVTTTKRKKGDNSDVSGHYVLIVGYEVRKRKNYVAIIDPATGTLSEVGFREPVYINGVPCFWDSMIYLQEPADTGSDSDYESGSDDE